MGVKNAYKSAEFLTNLIRGMAEGVIFIDDENIIRLCNPVGGMIRGVRGEEIIGKNFLHCHPQKTYEKVLSVIERLKNSGGEVTRTVRFKDGFYEHAYAAVRDSEGKFLGVVAVSRNITDRLVLERQLKEHAEKLERSNALKALFTDILSHDLLNPAGVISSYTDLMLDEDLPEDVLEYAIGIKKNAVRIIEMIQSANKYSKLEDSSFIDFEELDIGRILEEVVEEFKTLSDEKKIHVKYDNGSHIVFADPIIRDVFSNLISNAIKYSPNRSTIEIGIEENDQSLEVRVSDQADKIPIDLRPAIFERFKRVGKGSVKGSGLGLAIVKRIMDLHHGQVHIEDNPNGGNIFKVRLPKKNR